MNIVNSSQTIGKTVTAEETNTWDWIAPSRSEKGWECPRCGQIWAPWITKCDCNRSHTTITWARGTGETPDYVKQGYGTCITQDNKNIPHTYTL